MSVSDWLVGMDDIMARLEADPENSRVHYAIRHGSMRVGIYAPRGEDPQSPHTQDELYIVASGTGVFMRDGERRPFKPGDLIFVPAAADHRFEDFSDDFSAWVVFWGPHGGEG